MKPIRHCWICIYVLFISLFVCASRPLFAPPLHLNCNVTPMADGSYMYQVTRYPSSQCLSQSWLDHEDTVLARDFKFQNPNLHVLNASDRTIVLKECKEGVHFEDECPVRLRTACEVNCPSAVSDQTDAPNTAHPVDPNQPNSENKDLTQDLVWIGLAVVLVLVLVLAVCLCGLIYKCTRETQSYHSA